MKKFGLLLVLVFSNVAVAIAGDEPSAITNKEAIDLVQSHLDHPRRTAPAGQDREVGRELSRLR